MFCGWQMVVFGFVQDAKKKQILKVFNEAKHKTNSPDE